MDIGVVYYFVAALSIASAIAVVFFRNPVYSALMLVFTFFTLAVQFLLLEAYFLAVLEVTIYAGAIMVLFLFVIMLLNLKQEEKFSTLMGLQKGITFLLVAIFAIGLLTVFTKHPVIDSAAAVSDIGSVKEIGIALFTKYLYPFEIASVLLLIALLGTVYLAKRTVE